MKSIYENFSWAKKYTGTVVYKLSWGGKIYVGATSRFVGRLGDWRKYARRNSIDIKVSPLIRCSEANKEFYEELLVVGLRAYPDGYNKSPSGGLRGHRMHPNTAAALHKSRPMHPNTRAALARANVGRVFTEVQRKAVVASNKRRAKIQKQA